MVLLVHFLLHLWTGEEQEGVLGGKAGDRRSEDGRPAVVGDPSHPPEGGAGVRGGGGGG